MKETTVVDLALAERGATVRVAREFAVTKACVSHWRKRGVPASRARRFAELTGNRFDPADLATARPVSEKDRA